jgi:hypothetical protein
MFNRKTKLDNMENVYLKNETPTEANNLAAGICRHFKHQVAESEFYVNQKNPYSGTRIICLKCGKNKFIIDAKAGHLTTKVNLKDEAK